jgi:hypothetical protein
VSPGWPGTLVTPESQRWGWVSQLRGSGCGDAPQAAELEVLREALSAAFQADLPGYPQTHLLGRPRSQASLHSPPQPAARPLLESRGCRRRRRRWRPIFPSWQEPGGRRQVPPNRNSLGAATATAAETAGGEAVRSKGAARRAVMSPRAPRGPPRGGLGTLRCADPESREDALPARPRPRAPGASERPTRGPCAPAAGAGEAGREQALERGSGSRRAASGARRRCVHSPAEPGSCLA